METANELLAEHMLAGLRLSAWKGEGAQVTFEIFHIEWPSQIFGELRFMSASYLQVPTTTSWGYRLRIADVTQLASFSELEPDDVVYELFTPDGAEPSGFIVARSVEVARR